MSKNFLKKVGYAAVVATITVVGVHRAVSQNAEVKVWKSGDVLTADDLNASFAAQAGAGIPYAWSNFAPAVQFGGAIQPDGHVGQFKFTSPLAGHAWVTASFEIRLRNTFDTTKVNCRVESLLSQSTGFGNCSPAAHCSLVGYAQNTINANLPTQLEGGAFLGVTQVVSRLLPVNKGENIVYLNGRTDCADAAWGALTMTALFVRESPQSSVTMP